MLRSILKHTLKNVNIIARTCSQTTENKLVQQSVGAHKDEKPKEWYDSEYNRSVLEPINEDISHVSTYLKPTFNFAAYINKSETLQELVKLGVNLHQIEKNPEAVPFILGVKFEDIVQHINFLNDQGLNTDQIGQFITKNPLILQEDLDDLKTRISYLKYKKFADEMILHILEVNPLWLKYTTKEIDEYLGFFQKHFSLSGAEVRQVATRMPKLITFGIAKVKLISFVVMEEMGFSPKETKQIILKKPVIFMKNQHKLLKTFEYLHKEMNISLESIVETPEILTCRQKRLKNRHLFLTKLERAQYNRKEPNYVALITLVKGTDSEFSTEVAKSSIQAYNEFIKSC